jgi:rhamnogalacturonan endolyase
MSNHIFKALSVFVLVGVAAAQTAVTVKDEPSVFTLSNGYLTAEINKTTGDMTSLKFNGLELMGFVSGHHAGYWEENPSRAARLSASVTIDPAKNGGERAEVSIKGLADGKPLTGAGRGMICDLEIRYTLGRSDHGIYTYAIFSHQPSYGQTEIGESRFGAKLNAKVFDWLTIDMSRNKLMPTGYDWDHGVQLNMKEARRLTTGKYAGQVEHKYDYTAVQSKIPAFGWSSTTQHLGLYFINPTIEYLSGGVTKVELTGHLDDGQGGDPTLLDYWRGTHYGGSILPLAAGESWSKVVGPIFVYVNQGPNPTLMYFNALGQAMKEAAAWPYEWVQGVDYPHRQERGTVSGQVVLKDDQAATTTFNNLLVGLAYPDSAAGGGPMTWQNDAKHYQFWRQAKPDGTFTIANVRPGNYELHAIADGIFGEFAKTGITVPASGKVDLGKLEWKPVRYGRQLWEIGIPNRNASEFLKGDDYWHWGSYLLYAKLFPNDVHYVIGKSDYRKDWFIEQVPHVEQDDGTGRGRGRSTTWTVSFDLPNAPKGRATLRLGLCGAAARSIDVAVNDHHAGTVDGLVYNATINRDGIQGSWVEKNVAFDAALMKAGENTLKLTIPAGGLTSGVIYDYLRLELADGL